MKTQEQINRQIEGLKKMKQSLPEYSSFGDNNWAAIDAQLDILEGKAELDDFWQDETAEEFQDGDNDVYFAAEEAHEWMHRDNRQDDLFE